MKITKFSSANLYGESRKQEKSRLLSQRIKSVLQGKTRNISFGAGTTKYQKSRRAMILRKANLSTKTPRYLDVYNSRYN